MTFSEFSPAPRTDLDWAESHLDALYEMDGRGRLVARAAPRRGPPPRFHLVRTRLGVIWRFAFDLRAEQVRALARYAALEPACALDDALPPPPPDRLEPMRRVLEAEAPLDVVAGGPAYRFADGPSAAAALESRAVGAEVAARPDDPRLDAWAEALGERAEALRAAVPVAVSTFEGRIVSSSRVARGDPKRWVEAGVETVASARGRGHAPRCVAAWALAVRAEGGQPLYSTAWSNRASRRVAAKLGLELYAEDWHFR